MKDNIILIGMPGVGKSSAGVVLAKVLGYEFIDSDLVIQKATGELLKDIIAERGNKGFLEVENRINAGIEASHAVIATGGSVVYGPEAMEHLKSIGTVVYLKASYDTIKSRLGYLAVRGVAIEKGQTLHDLYDERVKLYEKYADVTVVIDDRTIEQTVNDIIMKK